MNSTNVRLALCVLLVAGAAGLGLVLAAPGSKTLVLVQGGGFAAVRLVQIAAGLYYQCFCGFLVLFGVALWAWPMWVQERKKPKQ